MGEGEYLLSEEPRYTCRHGNPVDHCPTCNDEDFAKFIARRDAVKTLWGGRSKTWVEPTREYHDLLKAEREAEDPNVVAWRGTGGAGEVKGILDYTTDDIKDVSVPCPNEDAWASDISPAQAAEDLAKVRKILRSYLPSPGYRISEGEGDEK